MDRYLLAKLFDRAAVRPFAAEDAVAAADLVYRTHGFRRPCDPDRLAERCAGGGGAPAALVAERADGRIVGLATLEERRAGTLVLDLTVDADPGGGAVARRLAEEAIAAAGRAGAAKVVFASSVRGPGPAGAGREVERALGALGFAPCRISFGGRGGPALVRTLVLARGRRALALPPEHRPIIERISAALGLERDELAQGAVELRRPPEDPIEVEIADGGLRASLRLGTADGAALDALDRASEHLRRGLVEGLEARVPLDAPGAGALAEALEARGFFFAGIDPEEDGRDDLVLARFLAPAGAVPDGAPAPASRAVAALAALDPDGDDLARALAAHVARRLGVAATDTVDVPAPGRPAAPPPDPAPAAAAREGAGAGNGTAPLPPLELIEFARLAGVKQLAAGLGHEINNPLNVILGSTCLLKSDLRERGNGAVAPEEAMARLGEIEEEVARIVRVLDGLRRFAHPEEALPERLSIADPIEDALALVEGEIRGRGCEISVSAPASLPPVVGNRSELAHAIFQLLRNAFEASPAGGAIAVEARLDGDRVVATVRDRGRGIAPEDRRRAFDPFFTTKEGAIGAGLGLPIARAIVEAHGGRLRLESRTGEGTTAIVELPAAREPVEEERRKR